MIEQGINDYHATGALLSLQHFLGRKAEALYLADRTPEALEAINEAEALAERIEHRDYRAELHWLRGIFLTAMGADEAHNFERSDARFEAEVQHIYAVRPETCVLSVER